MPNEGSISVRIRFSPRMLTAFRKLVAERNKFHQKGEPVITIETYVREALECWLMDNRQEILTAIEGESENDQLVEGMRALVDQRFPRSPIAKGVLEHIIIPRVLGQTETKAYRLAEMLNVERHSIYEYVGRMQRMFEAGQPRGGCHEQPNKQEEGK
jgi:hypothetical protein